MKNYQLTNPHETLKIFLILLESTLRGVAKENNVEIFSYFLVLPPSLGLARIWLELLAKKLGSARELFQKSLDKRNLKKRAYFKAGKLGFIMILRIRLENGSYFSNYI